MSTVRLLTALCVTGFVVCATPGEAKLSDFDRSYNQSGCQIIAKAIQFTAINYLTGRVPIRDILPSTGRMLDSTKVPSDIKLIAMRKSGDILGQLPPLKSKAKTSDQALAMAQKIGNYNLKNCLETVSRH